MVRKSIAAGIGALSAASALAGAAVAADLRYFAYEPDSDSAKFRTQDLILVVKPGLISQRVLKLYRRRGTDLPLKSTDGSVGGARVGDAVPSDQAEGLRVYAVDPQDGAGFAKGACKGAERAWVAFRPAKPYEPLRVFVLRYDAESRKAQLCETLDYRWRGEWKLPEGQRHFFSELGPSQSSR